MEDSVQKTLPLQLLFDKIILLSSQYQIKDRFTPVTLEKLHHDYDLEDKIKHCVNEFGALLTTAEQTNEEINPEFSKLYHFYTDFDFKKCHTIQK
jgi:hypothetical protein